MDTLKINYKVQYNIINNQEIQEIIIQNSKTKYYT